MSSSELKVFKVSLPQFMGPVQTDYALGNCGLPSRRNVLVMDQRARLKGRWR